MAYKRATSVQTAAAIRFGSGKMEIGANVGALVDVGAIRDGKFEHSFDKVTVPSDNAGPIELGIRNELVKMSASLMEINLVNLAKFYSGIYTHDTVAAAPVAITDETITLDDTDQVAFAHKNGDNSEVGAIVVTNGAASMTYVRDCDYLISVLSNGFTAIARAYPTVIEGTDVTKIAVDSLGKTYTLSIGVWDKTPAIGDHITFAGFAESANNGVKTVTAATDTVITVDEACTTEAEGATITSTMGGIASGDVILADYSYTPLASRTLKAGGKQTFDAQVMRFTNYDVDDKEFRITIWEATPNSGIVIDFPASDEEDPAMIPIEIEGRLDVSKASGEQLFEVYDEQHAS